MNEGEVIPFGKRLVKSEPPKLGTTKTYQFRSKDTKRNMQTKLRLKKLAANEETIDEVTKVSKSALAKKIHHGWHKGRGAFAGIASKAAHKYGSKAAGDRVAGAIMWKKYSHEETENGENTMSESIAQIVKLATEGNAAELKSAVAIAIGEKIATALEGKKVEIANNLVGLGENCSEKEPSYAHSDAKVDRAKKLAKDRLMAKAKSEGVEWTDEDAELILEAILEAVSGHSPSDVRHSPSHFPTSDENITKKKETGMRSAKKVRKETVDYCTLWFTEEEIRELVEEQGAFDRNARSGSSKTDNKTHAFGSEHKGTSGIPSELKRHGPGDIMSRVKKKVNESKCCHEGHACGPHCKCPSSCDCKKGKVSEENLDELSKKTLGSYIKKASRNAVRHTAQGMQATDKSSWTKHDRKLDNRIQGIHKATDKLTREENISNAPPQPGFGDRNTPNKPAPTPFARKTFTNPNQKDAMQYDKGNKKPGDIMSKTHKEGFLADPFLDKVKQSLFDEFQIDLDDETIALICEDILNADQLNEASPPGWQHVVKKLLQKGSGGVNPWAIAWSMKNKGYHAHKENQISRKSYEKWYKSTGKHLAHA